MYINTLLMETFALCNHAFRKQLLPLNESYHHCLERWHSLANLIACFISFRTLPPAGSKYLGSSGFAGPFWGWNLPLPIQRIFSSVTKWTVKKPPAASLHHCSVWLKDILGLNLEIAISSFVEWAASDYHRGLGDTHPSLLSCWLLSHVKAIWECLWIITV